MASDRNRAGRRSPRRRGCRRRCRRRRRADRRCARWIRSWRRRPSTVCGSSDSICGPRIVQSIKSTIHDTDNSIRGSQVGIHRSWTGRYEPDVDLGALPEFFGEFRVAQHGTGGAAGAGAARPGHRLLLVEVSAPHRRGGGDRRGRLAVRLTDQLRAESTQKLAN